MGRYDDIVDGEGGGHAGYLLRQLWRHAKLSDGERDLFAAIIERLEHTEELVQAQLGCINNLNETIASQQRQLESMQRELSSVRTVSTPEARHQELLAAASALVAERYKQRPFPTDESLYGRLNKAVLACLIGEDDAKEDR